LRAPVFAPGRADPAQEGEEKKCREGGVHVVKDTDSHVD
jgi:hypothetical protein